MPARNQKKVNSIPYLFGKLWQYSGSGRRNVLAAWGLFTIANTIYLLGSPLMWAKIVNVIQKQGATPSNIWTLLWWLTLTILFEVIFWVFYGPGRIIEQRSAFWIRLNYKRFLLKEVMTQPMEWHTEFHSGDVIDKTEKGTGALYEFADNSYEIIMAAVRIVISFIMLVYYCPSSSIIVLIMIVIAIWITIRFDTLLISQYSELNKIENQISASVFDAISNISTIIILRTERLIYDSIIAKALTPLKTYNKNIVANELKWCLTSVCCAAMTAVVLGEFLWRSAHSHTGIMLGTFFILVRYLEKIGETFFGFAGIYAGFIKRKSRIMNSEELTRDFKPENFTNHVLPAEWKKLRIEGLYFSYFSNEEKMHLMDVSMSLKKGERVALVGSTGSGKTTLLKVLRDLYHPQNLCLSVDGVDIPDGFGGIARAITLIPQDPEILNTTIFENITMGARHDMKDVVRFSNLACFSEVCYDLPRKFDTDIKEKGVNLSGGQQQRLALARGLLACQDKDIILLDEPTSSIDVSTEMKIYRNIFREFKGKTVISSIHRLHLLPLFDKIYMFDSGKIIGAGTLGELLSTCHEFQELWQQIEKLQS
jgi:ABC-type multidrug transport system fused ATPase/permease subunit